MVVNDEDMGHKERKRCLYMVPDFFWNMTDWWIQLMFFFFSGQIWQSPGGVHADGQIFWDIKLKWDLSKRNTTGPKLEGALLLEGFLCAISQRGSCGRMNGYHPNAWEKDFKTTICILNFTKIWNMSFNFVCVHIYWYMYALECLFYLGSFASWLV